MAATTQGTVDSKRNTLRDALLKEKRPNEALTRFRWACFLVLLERLQVYSGTGRTQSPEGWNTGVRVPAVYLSSAILSILAD